jgi:hypothetical protein
MSSEATNRATRREWRELGFFYDRDDQNKLWKLTGSRSGLLRFRDVLLSYVADPRNALKSEHEHYGPYSYLEVMTWSEAGFDDHAIRGPVAALARLAALIEAKLSTARVGSTVRIQEEFAADSPYALVLDLREDGFDPAAADPLLAAGRPLALDSLATRGTQTEPAFITRPAGAPVYHGFEVLSDVVVGDFTFGKITDFEVEICDEGDAFVVAPDNSRAGLVWEISDKPYFQEISAPEAERWGDWGVTFPNAMTSRENVRKNLESILPELKKRWEEWRRINLNK